MTGYRYSPHHHLRMRVEQLRRLQQLPKGCPQVILEEQHRMIRVALARIMHEELKN